MIKNDNPFKERIYVYHLSLRNNFHFVFGCISADFAILRDY